MSTILTFTTGLLNRLAATIPHQSTTTNAKLLLTHLLTELHSPQSLLDLLTLTTLVVLALELLNQLVYHTPTLLSQLVHNQPNRGIPVRGKHLDNFSMKDYTFIMVNKCMTGVFVYCYFGFLWSVRKLPTNDDSHASNTVMGGQGIFQTHELTLRNTLLPLPLLFLTYDFFYTLLHWALHLKSIYAYIHKHHHFQKAPSRANIDAVNVHPVEFFLGEFNHILALGLVVRGVPGVNLWKGVDVSWVGAVLFIGVGGVLAGLNHTRHDVVVSVPLATSSSSSDGVGVSDTDDSTASSSSSTTSNNNKKTKNHLTIFDSKHHDVHHRIPQSNYGQYTVFWDRIFGTFRDYDERDRVNPAYQLDPLTGKTVVVRKKKE